MSTLIHGVLGSRRFMALLLLLSVCVVVHFYRLVQRKQLRQTLGRYWNVLKSEVTRVATSADGYGCLLLYAFGFIVGAQYFRTCANEPGAFFYQPTLGGRLEWWAYGHFLAVFTVFSYALFRLVSGRALSLFATLLLATSPFQLYILVSSATRDYARSHLILPLIWLMGFLVKTGISLPKIVVCSAVMGMLCGIGNYVREEIVFFTVPALAVISLLLPYEQVHSRRKRLLGLMAFAIFFVGFMSRPILSFTSGSSLAGLMAPMDRVTGLSQPPYDIGFLFLDEYIAADLEVVANPSSMVASVSAAASGAGGDFAKTSGGGFLSKYIAIFPADFLIRFIATGERLLSFPFLYQLPPQGIENAVLILFYRIRSFVQSALQGFAIPFFMGTVGILALYSFRALLCYLGLLLMVSGMLSVQFWGKNYFYCEFISWWNVLLCIQISLDLRFKGRAVQSRWQLAWRERRAKVVLCGLVLSVPIYVGALFIARSYQEKGLKQIFAQYQAAPVNERRDPKFVYGTGHVLLRSPNGRESAGMSSSVANGAEVFRAEIGGGACPSVLFPILRYSKSEVVEDSRRDWSRTVTVFNSGKPQQLFFPAWERFIGIELPVEQASCLIGLERVDEPAQLPIVMTVALPLPVSGPYYKKLEVWSLREGRWIYPGEPSEELMDGLKKKGNPIIATDIAFQAPGFTMNGREWRFEGYAKAPVDPHMWINWDRSRSTLSAAWLADVSVTEVDTDLLYTVPRKLEAGAYVLVEGELYNGGIAIGLVRQGKSEGFASVVRPGAFKLVFKISSAGEYKLGMANKLFTYTPLENRFKIKNAYWVESL